MSVIKIRPPDDRERRDLKFPLVVFSLGRLVFFFFFFFFTQASSKGRATILCIRERAQLLSRLRVGEVISSRCRDFSTRPGGDSFAKKFCRIDIVQLISEVVY